MQRPFLRSSRCSRWRKGGGSAPHARGPEASCARDRVREDADPLDLDFDPIPRFEVAGSVPPFELASAWDRPASPYLSPMDRLEAGEEFDHLGERPEGPRAFPRPRVLEDHVPVAIPQPLLIVHADDDGLVSQLSELVARDDGGPEGVRPVFPRRGAHADLPGRHLD